MRKEITVKSASVYDARSLAELVGIANNYSSRITLVMDSRSINAKSIMGIMAFNPSEGMSINIVTEGSDEEEAVLAIEKFLVCE